MDDEKLPKIIYLPLMGTPHSGNIYEKDTRPPIKIRKDKLYNPRRKKKKP